MTAAMSYRGRHPRTIAYWSARSAPRCRADAPAENVHLQREVGTSTLVNLRGNVRHAAGDTGHLVRVGMGWLAGSGLTAAKSSSVAPSRNGGSVAVLSDPQRRPVVARTAPEVRRLSGWSGPGRG